MPLRPRMAQRYLSQLEFRLHALSGAEKGERQASGLGRWMAGRTLEAPKQGPCEKGAQEEPGVSRRCLGWLVERGGRCTQLACERLRARNHIVVTGWTTLSAQKGTEHCTCAGSQHAALCKEPFSCSELVWRGRTPEGESVLVNVGTVEDLKVLPAQSMPFCLSQAQLGLSDEVLCFGGQRSP